MLKITNLVKKFDDITVLENVSFDADYGEIVVIHGESGAGKTTLLRCICNLEKFDSGDISIDGASILSDSNNKNYQENVGLVFQNYNLFPHLSVIDNLILAKMCKDKTKKEEYKAQAMEILTKLNIQEKANSYPNQLSGGQKQRVAIARAVMLNPKVLCFDEPTSALDSKAIDDVIEIIKKLSEEMCILIITHDSIFAEKVATKSIKLEKGKMAYLL